LAPRDPQTGHHSGDAAKGLLCNSHRKQIGRLRLLRRWLRRLSDWQRCGSPLPRFPSTRCRTTCREPPRYRRAIVDRATEPTGPAGPGCCPP